MSAVTCLAFNDKFIISSSDDGTVKLWNLETGEFIRNLLALESGGRGGVVWRISMHQNKLVCAVGSRNGVEETKLILLDFDWPPTPLLPSETSSTSVAPSTSSSSSSPANSTTTTTTTTNPTTNQPVNNSNLQQQQQSVNTIANRMNQANGLYQMLSS
jgi:WD40 repeat protein